MSTPGRSGIRDGPAVEPARSGRSPRAGVSAHAPSARTRRIRPGDSRGMRRPPRTDRTPSARAALQPAIVNRDSSRDGACNPSTTTTTPAMAAAAQHHQQAREQPSWRARNQPRTPALGTSAAAPPGQWASRPRWPEWASILGWQRDGGIPALDSRRCLPNSSLAWRVPWEPIRSAGVLLGMSGHDVCEVFVDDNLDRRAERHVIPQMRRAPWGEGAAP